GKVLDKATLVVAGRHLDSALKHIPTWWGVLSVRIRLGKPIFHRYRPECMNPRREARSIVELLWLDDARALLEQRNLARGVRRKSRRVVWDRICEHFSIDEI